MGPKNTMGPNAAPNGYAGSDVRPYAIPVGLGLFLLPKYLSPIAIKMVQDSEFTMEETFLP